LKEFLAYARANPGKLNYGTPGNGTSPHIATEVFNREAKVKLNHVPYKGAGPALQDLIGGPDPGRVRSRAWASRRRRRARCA
jgi:tripartite-type tricarboxylate transporter receptor subunit TctC